jgi:hypothetical protein
MYRIYFINFGYFSQNESETLEGAKKIAKKAGFQSSILAPDGEIDASFCPISGFTTHRRAA